MGGKVYAPLARTQINRLKKDLDAFLSRCEKLPAGTDESADAYQYAYVRLCGLLEQSLLWVGRSPVTRLSHAEARSFAESHLERTNRNPTDDYIVNYVNRFSREWADDLAEWLSEDDRRSTVNALVGIRNGIAHGSSFGGSATWFSNYYVVVYELTDWLLEHFDPLPAQAGKP